MKYLNWFGCGVLIVMGYLAIWELDRLQPPYQEPLDECYKRGGVWIEQPGKYVCIKAERL